MGNAITTSNSFCCAARSHSLDTQGDNVSDNVHEIPLGRSSTWKLSPTPAPEEHNRLRCREFNVAVMRHPTPLALVTPRQGPPIIINLFSHSEQNNIEYSPSSPNAPRMNDTLNKYLMRHLSDIQVIKDNISPKAKLGIPFPLISQIREKLNDKGDAIAIAIRNVEQSAHTYLSSGHPTKNFHIKGKSSNWGPHQGLIPVRQEYSKLAARSPDKIKNANEGVTTCILNKFAMSVPFTIKPDAPYLKDKEKSTVSGRIEWVETQGGKEYRFSARPCKTAHDDELEVFVNEQKLEVLAYPRDWKCTITKDEGELVNTFLEGNKDSTLYYESKNGKSFQVQRNNNNYLINVMQRGEGFIIDKDCIHLMQELTGKKTGEEGLRFSIGNAVITPNPCMSQNPITADLDLFGVYSNAPSASKEAPYSQGQLSPDPQDMTPRTKQVIGRSEFVNVGNVTREVCSIIHNINLEIGNELIQHSAEANNPFPGDMKDNLPVTVILSDEFKSLMTLALPKYPSLFDKDVVAISLKHADAVSAFIPTFNKAKITGNYNPAWNKDSNVKISPTNGRTTKYTPSFAEGPH